MDLLFTLFLWVAHAVVPSASAITASGWELQFRPDGHEEAIVWERREEGFFFSEEEDGELFDFNIGVDTAEEIIEFTIDGMTEYVELSQFIYEAEPLPESLMEMNLLLCDQLVPTESCGITVDREAGVISGRNRGRWIVLTWKDAHVSLEAFECGNTVAALQHDGIDVFGNTPLDPVTPVVTEEVTLTVDHGIPIDIAGIHLGFKSWTLPIDAGERIAVSTLSSDSAVFSDALLLSPAGCVIPERQQAWVFHANAYEFEILRTGWHRILLFGEVDAANTITLEVAERVTDHSFGESFEDF
jgi:hypothetical protein